MNKFYPRPPHGGRRLPSYSRGWVLLFQSTPSAWRATKSRLMRPSSFNISIHALRVEGDARQNDSVIFFKISIHALRVEGDLQVEYMTLN